MEWITTIGAASAGFTGLLGFLSEFKDTLRKLAGKETDMQQRMDHMQQQITEMHEILSRKNNDGEFLAYRDDNMARRIEDIWQHQQQQQLAAQLRVLAGTSPPPGLRSHGHSDEE